MQHISLHLSYSPAQGPQATAAQAYLTIYKSVENENTFF